MIVVNLATLKAASECKLLFNEPTNIGIEVPRANTLAYSCRSVSDEEKKFSTVDLRLESSNRKLNQKILELESKLEEARCPSC